MTRQSFQCAGIAVDNLTSQEVLNRIKNMMDAPGASPRYVATVNLDFLVNARGFRAGNPVLTRVLRESAVNTADGMPLVWLSRLTASPLRERVTGSGLLAGLFRLCAAEGRGVFIMGGDKRVAASTSRKIKQLTGERIIKGFASPVISRAGAYLGAESEEENLIRRINASGARLLLLALGNPKQELWFARNKHRLKPAVVMGIGGGLNMFTGSLRRAPRWMRKTGLEWLFRLSLEPGRLWKRYLVDALFLVLRLLPELLLRGRTESRNNSSLEAAQWKP